MPALLALAVLALFADIHSHKNAPTATNSGPIAITSAVIH
jgi:hypothetical protein